MHTSSRTAPGKPGLPGEHCMELLRRQWLRASLVAHTVKNLPAMKETWMGKIPWRKECLTTPVFLPGESHGQKRLVGYSPWGHKKSDMTEQLTHTHAHTHAHAHTHIVDLQCCVNSCCTAKWLSYTHTHTHTHIYILYYIIFHCGLSQVTEYSSLCYANA